MMSSELMSVSTTTGTRPRAVVAPPQAAIAGRKPAPSAAASKPPASRPTRYMTSPFHSHHDRRAHWPAGAMGPDLPGQSAHVGGGGEFIDLAGPGPGGIDAGVHVRLPISGRTPMRRLRLMTSPLPAGPGGQRSAWVPMRLAR